MLSFIAEYQEAIIAVILLAVIGPSLGNYACSVVYRLPRGQTPFDKHPYCGHCGEFLKPVDLFPILSFLSTGGKCRYCGGKIPTIYTWIELTCGAVMIGAYFVFGMGELFLIYSAAAIFVIMMAAIYWQVRFISSFLYVVAALLFLLGDAFSTQAIFPAISRFVCVLVIGLGIEALKKRRVEQYFHIHQANATFLMALLALVTPAALWPYFIAAIALLVLGNLLGYGRIVLAFIVPFLIVIMPMLKCVL